jgi:hypothetical protein
MGLTSWLFGGNEKPDPEKQARIDTHKQLQTFMLTTQQAVWRSQEEAQQERERTEMLLHVVQGLVFLEVVKAGREARKEKVVFLEGKGDNRPVKALEYKPTIKGYNPEGEEINIVCSNAYYGQEV